MRVDKAGIQELGYRILLQSIQSSLEMFIKRINISCTDKENLGSTSFALKGFIEACESSHSLRHFNP
jgi:hypothetical protein